ncbi:MAG: hypothetical protein ACNS62_13610 [Candidatus Cyclobacteriaceae bacterium M3_2C_046]
MKNVIIIILGIAVVILGFLDFHLNQKIQKDSTGEKSHGRDSMLQVIDSLQQGTSPKNPSGCQIINPVDFQNLQKKGLQDPLEQLKENLMNHSELIPYDGTLGGEMKFYSKENIHVLNDEWVYAYFEDGHNAGQILLTYQIDSQGNINWEILKTSIN